MNCYFPVKNPKYALIYLLLLITMIYFPTNDFACEGQGSTISWRPIPVLIETIRFQSQMWARHLPMPNLTEGNPFDMVSVTSKKYAVENCFFSHKRPYFRASTNGKNTGQLSDSPSHESTQIPLHAIQWSPSILLHPIQWGSPILLHPIQWALEWSVG